MFGLSVADYQKFTDLPLEHFGELKYKVYVLDFDWNYLFVNEAVLHSLPNRHAGLIGANMWSVFDELRSDPAFQQMKADIESGKHVNFTTTSPITMRRLRIFGWPLEDCYLFTANTLPDKEELLNELRLLLNKSTRVDG